MEALFPTVALVFLMYGIYLAILVLALVSMWKIYVKMGLPGWNALVPVYNLWVMVKRLKKPIGWFWIQLSGMALFMLAYMVLIVLMAITAQAGSPPSMEMLFIPGIICFIGYVVMLVYSIKLTHALSKSFGQGAAFTVGLVLVSYIFYPILAFGDFQFTEPEDPKPVTSPVAVEPEAANDETTEESTEGSE